MKILIEAVGSMVSGATIKNIHDAGHLVIGTDASEDCFAKGLCDEFYVVPCASESNSFEILQKLVIEKKIDLVIPSLDEGMLKWANAKESLEKKGIHVAISSVEAIDVCEDKWKTYLFFSKNNIPTPKSSLDQDYPLIKPRDGRGGSGIFVANEKTDMTGMISQELLKGEEYTIDVFCDIDGDPVYIVPRKRISVKEGKSTAGVVVKNNEIECIVHKICKAMKFNGPINIQCFDDEKRGICFTEINPRLGGGTALGIAATENWIPLIVDTFVNKDKVKSAKNINYGLKMGRYYSEVFYK